MNEQDPKPRTVNDTSAMDIMFPGTALGTFPGGVAEAIEREQAAIKAAMGGSVVGTGYVERELKLLSEGGFAAQARKVAEETIRGHQTARDELKHLMGNGGVKTAVEELNLARGAISTRGIDNAQRLMDEALGIHGGSVGRTLADMKKLHGIDTGTVADISKSFGKLDTASSNLSDFMLKQDRDLGYDAVTRDIPVPALPPMPKNPILETNKLLRNMGKELAEQRELIAAMASAQQEETALVTKLIEVFTTSQVESGQAVKRTSRQAWIGIAIALASGLVPLLMAAFG